MKIARLVALLIILAALAGGFYWLVKNKSVAVPSNWLTFTDEAGVYTYRYPANLGTTYITPQEWPPQINLLEASPLDCVPAEHPTAHGGQTEDKIVNGHEYCVTTQVEGAAGSTYTDYAYLTLLKNKLIRVNLTLREPQCLNYDEPKQGECQAEQANFNLDKIIDQLVQSLNFKQP